jgi:hypothetical protein
MAGHRGRAVVENDQGEVVVVVNGVDQTAVKPEWKERRVADVSDHLFDPLPWKSRRRCSADEPMQIRKSPMASGGRKPKGVAADVRGIDGLQPLGGLFYRIEGGPVGAAGTQVGRPHGDFGYI